MEKHWFHHRVENAQQWTKNGELCLPLSERLVGFVTTKTGKWPPNAVFSGFNANVLKLSNSLRAATGCCLCCGKDTLVDGAFRNTGLCPNCSGTFNELTGKCAFCQP